MSRTPDLAEVGDFVIREELGGIRIVRADPRIRISAELLRQFHEHPEFPAWQVADAHLTLTCAGRCPLGDVLRIDAVGSTVVYRVTEADRSAPGGACWIAEWPD